MDKSSCIAKEPFIKLGEGGAPVIDYSLPQSSCLSLYGRLPAQIDQKWFKKECFSEPKANFWARLNSAGVQRLLRTDASAAALLNELDLGGLLPFMPAAIGANTVLQASANKSGMKATLSRTTPPSPAVKAPPAVPTPFERDLLRNLQSGQRPIVQRSLGGAPRVRFFQMPISPKPRIVILEEYEICSYLGNYGAGKTVRTFSLLPGEKTSISIKTYESRSDTSSQAESILDSFSQSSADEFESHLEDETGENTTKTSGAMLNSFDSSVTIPIGGEPVTLGLSADGQLGVSKVRQTLTHHLESTITKNVRNTAIKRDIKIDSSSSSTVTSGSDNSIVRELQNINHSRVLNFVFRQLQQEYITLISLKNVRFIYTNGYPESQRIFELPMLEEVLGTFIEQRYVKRTVERLLKPYCKVYNYRNEGKPFIELCTQEMGDCPFNSPAEKIHFFRPSAALKDEYRGIEVDGVILSARSHILPTSSVIAEALLGQGEALDCYNISLQEAAVDKAQQENRKTGLAIEALEKTSDPQQRAALYEQMFVIRPADAQQSGGA